MSLRLIASDAELGLARSVVDTAKDESVSLPKGTLERVLARLEAAEAQLGLCQMGAARHFHAIPTPDPRALGLPA